MGCVPSSESRIYGTGTRDAGPRPIQAHRVESVTRSRKVALKYVSDKVTGLFETRLDFRTKKHLREAPQDPTRQGMLFTDQDFPLYVAIAEYRRDRIEWKRPMEFCQNPVLFSDGTTRYDIGQGSAGTCWFLSMLASVAEKPDYIYRIIPKDGWNPNAGVLKCCFYRFGQWETVYTDDCLPVVYGNKLWGAKSASDDNEMWVAMVEKGFAKLYGSYNAIYGGQASDAYLALTGGVAEKVDLEQDVPDPMKLFRRVRNALRSGALVACTVPPEYDNYAGLVGGHAYSLNGTGTVDTSDGKEVHLIRVRNPWGHYEWKGPWSDGSAEWRTVVGRSVDNPNIDNGEFWISLEDFLTYFSQTTICNLTPDFDCDGVSDNLYYVTYIYGAWVGDKAAGYENRLDNPRYVFNLPAEGMTKEGFIPLVVQVIQRTKDRKHDRLSIRCDLFRTIGKSSGRKPACNIEILGKNTNVYLGEIQASFRHRVDPGEYMVIPSTITEGQEKEFVIRIFTSCPLVNVREMESGVVLRSCEEQKFLVHYDYQYPLSETVSLFGEWIRGVNSGGQVSHRDTFASNPQFAFSVQSREEPIIFHVMQDPEEKYPVGIRVFPLYTRPPVDINYLYKYYDNCPRTIDGHQGQFVVSHDVEAKYLLPSGDYLALIFLDNPSMETSFSLLVRSNSDISLRGYQTG